MNTNKLFKSLSTLCWNLLRDSAARRIQLGEDAITSFLLLGIQHLCTDIVVTDVRKVEAERGCDLELWMGADDSGWHRYAIQAKRMTISSRRYSTLGPRRRGTLQIDLLDRYAGANRAAPLYWFYNYVAEMPEKQCDALSSPEHLGCTVAPSAAVRRALLTPGARSLRWMLDSGHAVPLHCLPSCGAEQRCAVTEHVDWPKESSYYYRRLPAVLAEAISSGDFGRLQDSKGVSGSLFSRESALRPDHLAVVDVGKERVAQNARKAWLAFRSLFAAALSAGAEDLSTLVSELTPLQRTLGMSDVVFSVYIETCRALGALLDEPEFIAKLASFPIDDARLGQIVTYLSERMAEKPM